MVVPSSACDTTVGRLRSGSASCVWKSGSHCTAATAAHDALLADDVVFYSPIVYTPQEGKAITKLYLQAAGQTLPGDEAKGGAAAADDKPGRFRYTKTVTSGDTAVLEFETTVDGKYVNGVDIMRCNDAGRIVEFRVMIRPLQAINLVHEQ